MTLHDFFYGYDMLPVAFDIIGEPFVEHLHVRTISCALFVQQPAFLLPLAYLIAEHQGKLLSCCVKLSLVLLDCEPLRVLELDRELSHRSFHDQNFSTQLVKCRRITL